MCISAFFSLRVITAFSYYYFLFSVILFISLISTFYLHFFFFEDSFSFFAVHVFNFFFLSWLVGRGRGGEGGGERGEL